MKIVENPFVGSRLIEISSLQFRLGAMDRDWILMIVSREVHEERWIFRATQYIV